jgi:putative membrane protein
VYVEIGTPPERQDRESQESEEQTMMMWWGYGWPMLWMAFWNLLWLVLIGLCIWMLVRWLATRSPRRDDWHHSVAPEPSALEILRRRYARGDIDTATFEQMRERIIASGERETPSV